MLYSAGPYVKPYYKVREGTCGEDHPRRLDMSHEVAGAVRKRPQDDALHLGPRKKVCAITSTLCLK